MNIDISEMQSRDIIKLLSTYPQGHLEIKFERVFWCSDYVEPIVPNENLPARAFNPQMPPRGNGNIGVRFQKMGDTLGRMIGP